MSIGETKDFQARWQTAKSVFGMSKATRMPMRKILRIATWLMTHHGIQLKTLPLYPNLRASVN